MKDSTRQEIVDLIYRIKGVTDILDEDIRENLEKIADSQSVRDRVSYFGFASEIKDVKCKLEALSEDLNKELHYMTKISW